MKKITILSRRMKHRIVAAFLIVFMMDTSAVVVFATDAQDVEQAKCDIDYTSCTQDLPDMKVTLDIHPKPVEAMKDLVFTVIVSGKEPLVAPYIDLGMPGMHMGPNRVHLKSEGNNRYEGQGVIVRCPSGRKTWQATVTVPCCGSAEFVFDVIY